MPLWPPLTLNNSNTMKWIKASERLPERNKWVYLKGYKRLNAGYISKDWDEYQKAFYINIYHGVGENRPLSSYRDGESNNLKFIEWLDESPALEQEELWGEVEREISNVVYRNPAGSTHITLVIEQLKTKYTLTPKSK